MTKKAFVERNIGMAFDFIKQLIDHPETIESIPDGVELDFVNKEMPLKLKTPVKGEKVVRYKAGHVFEPIK